MVLFCQSIFIDTWIGMLMEQKAAIHIPKREVSRQRFANGTTLLYTPNPFNQIVAIRILIRLASRHEIREKAGMANLSMRLLSAGTETLTENEIAEKLERNGAHFKAEAGKDWGSINLLTTTHFLKDDLETVLELMERPIFPEEKLQREREIVRMNILEQEDSRLTLTIRIFRQHYFGSHPYSWPSLGLIETLDAIQRDDVSQFAHRAFDPANLIVSVVGGEEEGQVRTIVSEAFASRTARGIQAVSEPIPATSAVTSNSTVLEKRESESEYIVMGYPGCGIMEPAATPLRIISALMGGSMDSRLFREIRDKRGLCYQIGSSYAPQQDHSPFLVYIVTTPSNREEAVTCTEAEIERLKNETVSEEELERVKTYVCGTYVMAMETNMGQASRYAAYEIAGLGWEYANRFADDIYSITNKEITQTAQNLFTHRLLTITTPS